MNWQPMSTAPRDGTIFFAANNREFRFVRFDDEYDRYPISHDRVVWSEAPTRWVSTDNLIAEWKLLQELVKELGDALSKKPTRHYAAWDIDDES